MNDMWNGMKQLRAFIAAEQGTVVVVFALSILPLMARP
jgi:hypothetical protein